MTPGGLEDCQTGPNTIFALQTPSLDVWEPHKIRRSPDLEALKLWKSRSRTSAPTLFQVNDGLQKLIFCKWRLTGRASSGFNTQPALIMDDEPLRISVQFYNLNCVYFSLPARPREVRNSDWLTGWHTRRNHFSVSETPNDVSEQHKVRRFGGSKTMKYWVGSFFFSYTYFLQVTHPPGLVRWW